MKYLARSIAVFPILTGLGIVIGICFVLACIETITDLAGDQK